MQSHSALVAPAGFTPRTNGTAGSQRSEFARRASRIGLGIHSTSQKLNKLAQLAKRTSMFDDPAAEINDLTGGLQDKRMPLHHHLWAHQSMVAVSSHLQGIANPLTLTPVRTQGPSNRTSRP